MEILFKPLLIIIINLLILFIEFLINMEFLNNIEFLLNMIIMKIFSIKSIQKKKRIGLDLCMQMDILAIKIIQ